MGADHYTGPACSAKVHFIVLDNVTNAVNKVGRVGVNERPISLDVLETIPLSPYWVLLGSPKTGFEPRITEATNLPTKPQPLPNLKYVWLPFSRMPINSE